MSASSIRAEKSRWSIERSQSDAGETRGEPGHPQRLPASRRLAGSGELAPPVDERDEEDDPARRLLEVEALREVRRSRAGDERDCELPGAVLPAHEGAPEPDEEQAEGERDDARALRHPGRQDAADDLEAAGRLRGERRDDPDEADEGGARRDQACRLEQARTHRSVHRRRGATSPAGPGSARPPCRAGGSRAPGRRRAAWSSRRRSRPRPRA